MDYVQSLRQIVGTRPLILVGSVAIVLNDKNEILLQQRPDEEWGLPGGLLDLGESLEEAARREVKEETGLDIGELKQLHVFSGPEFYIKVDNGDEFYAVTGVFLSRDITGGQLEADGEESLDVKFFRMDEMPENIKRNYKKYMGPFLEGIKKREI